MDCCIPGVEGVEGVLGTGVEGFVIGGLIGFCEECRGLTSGVDGP